MRQHGLAMHNYENAHKYFPAACYTVDSATAPTKGNPAGKETSWTAFVLTNLEQGNVNYDFTKHWWETENRAAATIQPSVLSVHQLYRLQEGIRVLTDPAEIMTQRLRHLIQIFLGNVTTKL